MSSVARCPLDNGSGVSSADLSVQTTQTSLFTKFILSFLKILLISGEKQIVKAVGKDNFPPLDV